MTKPHADTSIARSATDEPQHDDGNARPPRPRAIRVEKGNVVEYIWPRVQGLRFENGHAVWEQ